MASGFSGGGGAGSFGGSGLGGGGVQDFFSGRSSLPTMNIPNHRNTSSLPPYRTNHQIFLDQNFSSPSTLQQIAQNRAILPTTTAGATTMSSLIGKRTLADYQAFQSSSQPQPNLLSQVALNSLLLRSVKPRISDHSMFQQNTYPTSTLSPIELSGNSLSPELSTLMTSQRYRLPLLQPLRHHLQQQHPPPQQPQQQQPMNLNGLNLQNQGLQNMLQPNGSTMQNQNGGGNGIVVGQDREKKMLNQLQELEKQLLDDDDDNDEGDAVSVITNTNTNSEWSETIQNLIGSPPPCNNAISPSPTSSSSSTSSTVTTTPVSKQTVIEAASAICEGKSDVVAEILTRVSQVSNPRGNSEQRLMEYMLMALKSRVNSVGNPPPVMELYGKEHVDATQLLYDLSPCFKLGFMAANLAIIEATTEQDQQMSSSNNGFHVVDFDIGQGGQYRNLLYALSSLQISKPAIVKITAVAGDNNGGGEERERLRIVGEMLKELADRVGVNLSFNIISCKLSELSRESLGCEPDEALAVNFAFKLYRMPDESVSTENPRDELLRRVKGLGPRVVTVVEQEMNTNTAPFMARVNECCSYYGALFDSISAVERDNSERVKVEEGLGRRMINSVACEGRDRVERCEVFGKWRARMGMAGFELKPMSQNVAESMKARLGASNRVNPGFTVKEECGGVCFGWIGKTLTVASAWR